MASEEQEDRVCLRSTLFLGDDPGDALLLQLVVKGRDIGAEDLLESIEVRLKLGGQVVEALVRTLRRSAIGAENVGVKVGDLVIDLGREVDRVLPRFAVDLGELQERITSTKKGSITTNG